jgi:hypothetical protein
VTEGASGGLVHSIVALAYAEGGKSPEIELPRFRAATRPGEELSSSFRCTQLRSNLPWGPDRAVGCGAKSRRRGTLERRRAGERREAAVRPLGLRLREPRPGELRRLVISALMAGISDDNSACWGTRKRAAQAVDTQLYGQRCPLAQRGSRSAVQAYQRECGSCAPLPVCAHQTRAFLRAPWSRHGSRSVLYI